MFALNMNEMVTLGTQCTRRRRGRGSAFSLYLGWTPRTLKCVLFLHFDVRGPSNDFNGGAISGLHELWEWYKVSWTDKPTVLQAVGMVKTSLPRTPMGTQHNWTQVLGGCKSGACRYKTICLNRLCALSVRGLGEVKGISFTFTLDKEPARSHAWYWISV